MCRCPARPCVNLSLVSSSHSQKRKDILTDRVMRNQVLRDNLLVRRPTTQDFSSSKYTTLKSWWARKGVKIWKEQT
jgi:hypothetical protein